MLYIRPSLNYKSLKKEGKGSIALPSNLINNFLVRSLDKYGILSAPEELLEKIIQNPELTIYTTSEYSSIYTRPLHGNLEQIFSSALNKLKNNEDVFATPEAAALFIEWYSKGEIDFLIEIDTKEVKFEELGEAFSKFHSKPFHPNDLEMLLKLFSLFYAKEIEQKDIDMISKVQILLEKLADKEKNKLEELDFSRIKIIAQELDSKQTFGTNNIFNKILEEIEKVEALQHYDYEIDNFEELAVFHFKEETKEFFKNQFISFMELIDESEEENEDIENINEDIEMEEERTEDIETEQEEIETSIPPQALKILKRAESIGINFKKISELYNSLEKKEDKKKYLRELEKRTAKGDSSDFDFNIKTNSDSSQNIKKNKRAKKTVIDYLNDDFRRITANDNQKHFAFINYGSLKKIEKAIKSLNNCVLENYLKGKEKPKEVSISYNTREKEGYAILIGVSIKIDDETIVIEGDEFFNQLEFVTKTLASKSNKIERLRAYLNNSPIQDEDERNRLVEVLIFGRNSSDEDFENFAGIIREIIEGEIAAAIAKDSMVKKINDVLIEKMYSYHDDIEDEKIREDAKLFDFYHILVVDSKKEREAFFKSIENLHKER
ncbi:MAG: hypothetical protein M0P91_04705 [Sulfuricurvum sp.]|uniref:hypothetical protein n=1 Tax=Sulfuricurvum sp. TaxID=2025608 RepID=UPI0025D96C57|nr:hypothetical protein [Sulfuricurvum sp.]MCK9372476.1 hypothetical protein [Sulfuricurvum sp.]